MSQHTLVDPSCLHLEHACQMRLEARDPRPLAADPRLAEHAAGCASCRSVLAGFDALQASLLRPAPAILPTRDLAAAVIAAVGRPRRSILAMPMAGDWRWAVAATVVAAGVVGLGIWRLGGDRPAEVAGDGQRIANPLLQQSLADARAATWALAEETTAPAARVGRDLFNPGATVPSPSPAPTFSMVDPSEPAAVALRSVGEGLGAGVRPLGGSARHAFGFLVPNLRRPAAPDRPGEPTPRTF